MENTRNKSTKNVKTLCDIIDMPGGTENNLDEVKDDFNLNTEQFEVIFVEPFYGGSHKQLVDTLRKCKFIESLTM